MVTIFRGASLNIKGIENKIMLATFSVAYYCHTGHYVRGALEANFALYISRLVRDGRTQASWTMRVLDDPTFTKDGQPLFIREC